MYAFIASSYCAFASRALASNGAFSSAENAFHLAPSALPTSPMDAPGFSATTEARVSPAKIMYEESGRLGAFGSFFFFAVFFFVVFAFFAEPGDFLAFFFAGASPSLSSLADSLPDSSVGSPPSLSLSDPAAKSSSSSESDPPCPSSSTSERKRDAWWSSSSSSSMSASARALASTLEITSCFAVRKLTRFWNSLLGMPWNVCAPPPRMETATSNVRCVAAACGPLCRSNSTDSTSA